MSRVAWTQLRPAEDAEAVREAIDRVLDRGWFVLGPEVEAFEGEFSAATGNTHTVGVASGTDALILALRGLGIGPGDEVITTALSAVYTAQAIMMTGARPVFADLDRERLTLDPKIVASLIGPRTAAILPVHLYGQPADMPALAGLADTDVSDTEGAIAGAVVGAIAGGGARMNKTRDERRQIVVRCMQGRGHSVVG